MLIATVKALMWIVYLGMLCCVGGWTLLCLWMSVFVWTDTYAEVMDIKGVPMYAINGVVMTVLFMFSFAAAGLATIFVAVAGWDIVANMPLDDEAKRPSSDTTQKPVF